ncbi:MAG TPA: hypothetical protein VF220_02020 [Nitrososphaeraceae archaeon]
MNNMSMEKQQEQRKEEIEKEQRQQFNPYKNENNAYSLFLYGVRSPITRDYYLRRPYLFQFY